MLQLQQRNAGISFNERVRSGDVRDVRARPAATAAAPDQPKDPANKTPAVSAAPSGLFGSGATPMLAAQRNATVSSGPTAPPASAYAAGGRSSSMASNGGLEPPRWLLLPRDIIEYVRDNRGTVIGSVVTLCGLTWVGSLFFSRRRT